MLKKSMNWSVIEIRRDIALPFINSHHFLAGLPAVCWSFALCDTEGSIQAIASFSTPTSPSIVRMFPDVSTGREVFQLCKLVLPSGSEKNSGTYLLARAIKMMLKKYPSTKYFVTYCDLSRNHQGFVFKAANWQVHGLSSPGGAQGFLENGAYFSAKNGNSNRTARNGRTPVPRSQKIRYVFSTKISEGANSVQKRAS